MQTQGASAWSNQTGLTLRELALPSEGPPINNAGYLTGSVLETSDRFLTNPPLLKFLAQHRSETVRFLIDQIALNQSIHNVEVDLPAQAVDDPYVLNRGSVPYSVENARVTRRLTDWVYDPTDDRVLMLLAQSEGHIADILVQYDVKRDTYRTLYTFDKDIKAHRIARRTATDYYILTSGAITQDRSGAELPRTSDKTGYAYDSVAEGSTIDIYHYHADSGAFNVSPAAHGADLKPQLGIHYHVGFENRLYIDEFEGIRPEYRGAFKSVGTDVYYRYATDEHFGIARLLNNGATRRLTHNSVDIEMDAFFTATSLGDIYIVPEAIGNGGTPSGDFLHTFSPPSGLDEFSGMTIDAAGNVYAADNNGDEIFVFPASTAEGTTATASREFNLPSGATRPAAVAIDGNNLFIMDRTTATVYVVPADTADGTTATTLREFTVDIADLSQATGFAIRGNELFIASRSNNRVYVVDATTADGGTATADRVIRLPSELSGVSNNVEAMAIFGNELALSNPKKVYIVSADTPNNATAEILREINIENGSNNNITALAVGKRTFSVEDVQRLAQSLNFAFDVTTAGTVYFAQAVSVFRFSILILKSRDSGGTETLLLADTKRITDLTDLDSAGGTYEGVHECLFHNNLLYLLCPIGRVDVDDDGITTRSQAKAAGMVLYQCDVTAATPTLTVVDKWDFVSHSACGLTVHDGGGSLCGKTDSSGSV